MIMNEELMKIDSFMNKTRCSFDPFSSKLLLSHLPTIVNAIMHIHLCFSTCVFLSLCKPAINFLWHLHIYF